MFYPAKRSRSCEALVECPNNQIDPNHSDGSAWFVRVASGGENGGKDIPRNRIYDDKKNNVCFQAGHRRSFVHFCRGQCGRMSSSDIPGSGQNGGVGAEGCSPGLCIFDSLSPCAYLRSLPPPLAAIVLVQRLAS